MYGASTITKPSTTPSSSCSRASSAPRTLSTTSSARVFASPAKNLPTYTSPTASPSAASTIAIARFHRGFCSCWPLSAFAKNSKWPSTNAFGRWLAYDLATCQRR